MVGIVLRVHVHVSATCGEFATDVIVSCYKTMHSHTLPSKTFKKLTGVYDGQIRSGKTAVDMPALQLAALQRSVMASCTGPYGGLCQLDPDKDSPTHDRGV